MVHCMRVILLFTLMLVAAPVVAPTGARGETPNVTACRHGPLAMSVSPYDVPKTVDRILAVAKSRGASVLAKVDHAAAAEKNGFSLRPTVVVLIGNPKLSTQLMQSDQTVGLDLPLRVLVWQDPGGVTQVGYVPPAAIAAGHGITDRDEVIDKMNGALAAVIKEAVTP